LKLHQLQTTCGPALHSHHNRAVGQTLPFHKKYRPYSIVWTPMTSILEFQNYIFIDFYTHIMAVGRILQVQITLCEFHTKQIGQSSSCSKILTLYLRHAFSRLYIVHCLWIHCGTWSINFAHNKFFIIKIGIFVSFRYSCFSSDAFIENTSWNSI